MPPENRLAVASVTTKLFTPVLVMAIPLSHPSTPPKANVAAIASGIPLRRPSRAVFSQDTGELAMDVIELTEMLHVSSPGREFSLVDHGLRHMVDNDRQVRVALDETDCIEYVPRFDQCIETQSELGKLPYHRIEFGTQDPIIFREVLQVGPNTLQYRRTSPLREVSDRVGSQHIHPPDDAADEVVSVGKTQEV